MIKRLLIIVALLLVTPAHARIHGGGRAVGVLNAGGGGVSPNAATNWLLSMISAWTYNSPEGTASSASNVEGDATNNLTDSGSATRSVANVVEGDQALSLASASSQLLSCATTTCADLKTVTGADITFGCLDVYRATVATQRIMDAMASSRGYRMEINSSNVINGEVGAGVVKSSVSVATLSTATHYSALTVWDSASGDELHVVVNGASSGTATNADAWDTTGLTTFRIGSSGSGRYFNGQLDECFVDNAAWTDQEACRASNCGLSGLYCNCDGTTPANYLACSTNADCQVGGNMTAVCTSSTCKGRNRCSGTQAACNSAAPS